MVRPLGINRLASGLRPQIPASPLALPGGGSAERRDGSYLASVALQCSIGNWRIVQLCGRRQMYGTTALVYPTFLPVAPFGRQTGTTASDLGSYQVTWFSRITGVSPFFFTPEP